MIVRLGLKASDDALLEPHVSEFNITGRAMKGWVLVEPEGVAEDGRMTAWIQRVVTFMRTLPAN
jgi:hypothetical protein